MSQVTTYTIGNLAGAAFRAALNAITAAIRTLNSGATAPTETAPYMLWVDTGNAVIMRRNSADSAWVLHDSAGANATDAKSSAYTAAKSDHKRFIRFTGSGGFTLAFTAAATLGEGWNVMLRNDSTGTITLDPNGAEQIDGGTTLSLLPGQSCTVVCTGSAFYTYSLSGGAVTDTARVDVASAATVDLTAAGPAATRSINITGTTAITGFTVAAGRLYFVTFAASLTLTNGASLVTNTGANIVTQPGDTCVIRATAANTVEVALYSRAKRIQLSTAQATTSGTSRDWTGVPDDAKRVTLNIEGLSSSGTSPYVVQARASAAAVTSGYQGSGSNLAAASLATTQFTNGAGVAPSSVAATSVRNGRIVFELIDKATNKWSYLGALGGSDGAVTTLFAGAITLAAAFDGVRLTTSGGTDTFDAGTSNLSWEA